MTRHFILLVLLVSGLSAPLHAQFMAFNVDFLSDDNDSDMETGYSQFIYFS